MNRFMTHPLVLNLLDLRALDTNLPGRFVKPPVLATVSMSSDANHKFFMSSGRQCSIKIRNSSFSDNVVLGRDMVVTCTSDGMIV